MTKLTKTVVLIVVAVLLPNLAFGEGPQRLSNWTRGGRQFWGDVEVFHEWRIQRNVFTGHFRLLDGDNYRQAWGSLEDCRKALEDIKQRDHLPPMSGKAVILVHGLLGNANFMKEMTGDVRKAGYYAVPFTYPSSQTSIEEAGEYLHQVMDSLQGIEEIYFVCHSLGGLVVRCELAEHPDQRVKGMVLIGVPNTGAHLADIAEGNPLYKLITGEAGQELVTSPEGFIASLPAPPCAFAIIAGGRSDNKGYNPLIPGDDDGIVAVSSTQLTGNADFAIVREIHHSLPDNEEVRKQTLTFLRTGKLREATK